MICNQVFIPGLPAGNVALSRLTVQAYIVTNTQLLSSHQLSRHHHYVTISDAAAAAGDGGGKLYSLSYVVIV